MVISKIIGNVIRYPEDGPEVSLTVHLCRILLVIVILGGACVGFVKFLGLGEDIIEGVILVENDQEF